jgi:hypothetical protein
MHMGMKGIGGRFFRGSVVAGAGMVLVLGVLGGCEKPAEPVKPPAPTTPKADETPNPKSDAPKPGEDVPPPPPSDK